MNDKPFQPFGGYERLKSYQLAEVLYDATVVFCERFFAQDRRMTDQMVQAARSGVRNLSEGSGAAATSKKSEMFLTNVARASLRDELLPDYRSFLRQRGLQIWGLEDPRCREMCRRLKVPVAPNVRAKPGVVVLSGLDGLIPFVREGVPEAVGNALICLLHQTSSLIWRQMRAQMRQFEQEGGFSEQMYRRRTRRELPE